MPGVSVHTPVTTALLGQRQGAHQGMVANQYSSDCEPQGQ